MKPIIILLLALFAVPIASFSQNNKAHGPFQLQGIIIAAGDKLSLAYASVGLLNKPVGTIADSSGHFALTLSPENMADTVQISMVGYLPLMRPVREFENSGETIVISLTKK
ncbi:hypothetical protein MgSA37_01173 [Mucilaginibacter gotjawali]|nr:carboxypeptidase-like regulatory domain-containing protein [Mucilaginibacter gotjawali]BAU53006.1 hypothetical protein MgSA37_01173 [Mucilaginibacter gotjawali]